MGRRRLAKNDPGEPVLFINGKRVESDHRRYFDDGRIAGLLVVNKERLVRTDLARVAPLKLGKI